MTPDQGGGAPEVRPEEVDDLGDIVTSAARSLLARRTAAPHASFFFDFQGAVVRLAPALDGFGALLTALLHTWVDVLEGDSVFLMANVVPHRHSQATLVLQLAQTAGAVAASVVTEVLDSDLSPLEVPAAPSPSAMAPVSPLPLDPSAHTALRAWHALGGTVVVGESPREGRVVHAQVTLPTHGVPHHVTSAADHGLVVWLVGEQPDRLEAMTRRLCRLGWRVTVVTSVAEVAARLGRGESPPHLLLGWERFGVPLADLEALVPAVGKGVVYLLRDLDAAASGAGTSEVGLLRPPLSPSLLHALTTRALAAAGRSLRPHGPQAPTPAKRPLALVVDDNLVNQMLATAMLNLLGYEVDVANDGREAVSQCLRSAPALVLMDLDMPVLDGYGAARAIREHQAGGLLPAFPIVPATAQSPTADVLKATRDAGMTGFIGKPLDVQVLREQVARVLRETA